MKDLKVVFMGTPTFSVPALKYLIENTNVILVVSQPDREKDRKGNLQKTPTKCLAEENNIEVFQPIKLKEEQEKIIALNPDIIITCAYGQIVPESILNCPKYGSINIHGSLLPKLRGGAPIHHAIINGDKETGITIMYMSKKMDAGDIISQQKITIEDTDNLDSLYEKMSMLGAKSISETLPSIIEGTNKRISQNESEVTFGYNITKEEEHLDFNKTSTEIYNHIRGLSSIPGAFCYLDNKRIKAFESIITSVDSKKEPGTIDKIDKSGIYVNTKDKIIILTNIQLEGHKRCNVSEIINGLHPEDFIGKMLK